MRHALSAKVLAASLLLALSASAQAALQAYTSQASFLAAIGSFVTDTFDDLTPGAALPEGPVDRSVGGIDYTARSGPDSAILYGAGGGGDAWLSTNVASDTITFDSFAPGVYAAGANLFGSDINGEFLQRGLIVIRATDSDGNDVEFRFRATQDTFFGFVSDGQLSMLEVRMFASGRNPVWPTVNNLILAAVPEPKTYALMLAGLAAVGFLARRRRR